MKKILIVDDLEENLYLLRSLLENSQYKVLTAKNGVEALEAARQELPDLIISDILMPVMDGFSFCRACKSNDDLRTIPFVFYTATYTEQRDEDLALSLGAARFIVKPIEPDAFLKILTDLMDSYESGSLPQPAEPIAEETTYYRLYNEVLIHKLESKMLALEQVNRQLQDTKDHLSLAIRAANVGLWDWNVQTNQIRFSVEWKRQIGYEDDELVSTVEAWSSRIHPDDWNAVSETLQKCLQTGCPDYRAEYRFRHKDGSFRWVLSQGSLVTDSEGRPWRLMGAHIDLTAQKKAEEQIANSESELRAIFAAMRDLVLIIDHDGIYQKVAPTSPELLVLPADELLGKSLADVFSKERGAEFLKITQGVIDTQTPSQIEYVLSIRGVDIWFAATITPMDATSAVWVVRDITNSKAAEMENQRLLKESQERLHRVETLHAIELAVTANIDLRLTLNTLLTYVIMQLKVDAANVMLVNESTQALEYAAGQGFFTRARESARVRLGESFAGRAVLERIVVKVDDLNQEPGEAVFANFVKAEHFRSYISVPLIAKGQVKGVLEVFHRSPLKAEQEWLDFLETIAGQAAIAIDNAQLLDGLERSNVELKHAYDATIEGWSRAMDLRDRETEGHTQRVVNLTLELARHIGVDESLIPHILRGALLHDMGKMGVPDHILFKPGRLTETEWTYMKKHPEFAYEMLSSIDYLKPALDIPYCHHEWWNGSGYPRGLKGAEIPLAARIFSVVDAWDALTSDRPYRAAMSSEEAVSTIQQEAGSHFDPRIVDAFFVILSKHGQRISTNP